MKSIICLSLMFCVAISCQDNKKEVVKIFKMTDAMGKVYWSSSELDPPEFGFGKYGMHNIFDEDLSTAWVEGKEGDGVGESIILLSSDTVSEVELINGYAKTSKVFKANNRIKDLNIAIYNIKTNRSGQVTEKFVPVELGDKVFSFNATLLDHANLQKIVLPKKISGNVAFKFTIKSIYHGSKYKDTCLTELKLKKVFQEITFKNNAHEIWVGDQLAIKNSDEVYQLIEVSKDGNWAIVTALPTNVEGRAESTYYLFSAEKKEFVPVREVDQMYGFKVRDNKLFLEGYSLKENKDRLVEL